MPFGFLDFPMIVPAWGVALLFCWGWFVSMYFIGIRIYWIERRYCPERNLLIDARKKGLPLIGLVDIGSNNATLELGVKKKSDDIAFDSKYSGIRIDPILTSVGCEPIRLNGIDVYWYAFENWLPQTVRNHLGFKAIAEYKRAKCPDLAFLTDIEFTALISTPETHLEHDLAMYVSKYFRSKKIIIEEGGVKREVVRHFRQFNKEDPDTLQMDAMGKPIPGTGKMAVYETEVSTIDLVNRIEQIKNDLTTTPIARGFFAMTEAFKNNAYAYAAQDLEMLLIIHDKQGLAEWIKKINVMIYAVAAMIVAVGGGLGFYMVTQAIKTLG